MFRSAAIALICAAILIDAAWLAVGRQRPWAMSTSTAIDVAQAVEILPREINFGSVAQSESRQATFRLLNQSVHPVSNLRASTTCGCSVVHNLKSTLAPGESTECTIAFHASNRRGPSTVVVLFRFDVVGTSHDHPASVFADVRPSVIYSPAALHFKADPSAGHQSAHVEFSDTTRSELALSSAACSHNAFSARISDPVAAESGELSAPATVGVEITFDPRKWSSTPQNNRAALIVYTDSQFDSYLAVPLYVDR